MHLLWKCLSLPLIIAHQSDYFGICKSFFVLYKFLYCYISNLNKPIAEGGSWHQNIACIYDERHHFYQRIIPFSLSQISVLQVRDKDSLMPIPLLPYVFRLVTQTQCWSLSAFCLSRVQYCMSCWGVILEGSVERKLNILVQGASQKLGIKANGSEDFQIKVFWISTMNTVSLNFYLGEILLKTSDHEWIDRFIVLYEMVLTKMVAFWNNIDGSCCIALHCKRSVTAIVEWWFETQL